MLASGNSRCQGGERGELEKQDGLQYIQKTASERAVR